MISLLKARSEIKSPLGQQILIVDDEPLIRSSLRHQLEGEGRVILDCGTGVEAIALIKNHEIELVLLDIHGVNLDRAHRLCQLDGRQSESAHAEDGYRFTGFDSSFVQRVQSGRRGAHQRCAGFERNLCWKRNGIARWHHNPFRVSAIDMVAEHFDGGAELFVACNAMQLDRRA